MSLAMISKDSWEKDKMNFPSLKQEVVFSFPASLDESQGNGISLVSYLEVEFSRFYITHLHIIYVLKFWEQYMYTHVHTPPTIFICK